MDCKLTYFRKALRPSQIAFNNKMTPGVLSLGTIGELVFSWKILIKECWNTNTCECMMNYPVLLFMIYF